MNPLTLEEARTLVEFSKQKNIAKTATAMAKSNSAIVYALDAIQEKTGLAVFNREGYRTTLTQAGGRVLEACQQLLDASAGLTQLCQVLGKGWESDLTLVMEGIVPLRPVLRTIQTLSNHKIPTRFHLFTEFMGTVEQSFRDRNADLMISVLNPVESGLESIALPEIPAFLVAHQNHPATLGSKKLTPKQLSEYPILTVRGSAPQLNMSTASIESASTIQLNDFYSKKLAIMKGLGFGWMPQYLIEAELKSGQLQLIRWTKSSKHVFKPYLFSRSKKHLGNAGRLFIDTIARDQGSFS